MMIWEVILLLRTFYNMKKHDVASLEKNKFRKDGRFSGEGETIYIHTFPVYRYLDRMIFYGRMLTVMETGETRIDIIDSSDGSMYAPWYYEENDIHQPLTTQIKYEVEKEMRKVGVTYARKNKNKVSQ